MLVTQYRIKVHKKAEKEKLVIALVSDLHDRDVSDLLKTLKEMSPDLILVAGDLMERHKKGEIMHDGNPNPHTVESMDEWMGISTIRHLFTKILKFFDGSLQPEKDEGKRWDRKNGYRFLKEASMICPIYYSMGNHEWYHTKEDMEVLAKTGTVLLDNADALLDEYPVRLGGLSTRYDLDWLKAFSEQDGFKILLCHHPDYCDKYVKELGREMLVLSGHVHGGQFRFFGRGIFAPGQGFLPKYHQ